VNLPEFSSCLLFAFVSFFPANFKPTRTIQSLTQIRFIQLLYRSKAISETEYDIVLGVDNIHLVPLEESKRSQPGQVYSNGQQHSVGAQSTTAASVTVSLHFN
jgi:hypothetical protein